MKQILRQILKQALQTRLSNQMSFILTLLVIAVTNLWSSLSLAATQMVHFDGSQLSPTVQLTDTQTHTESRLITITSICHHYARVGTRRVCHIERHGENRNHRVCHSEPVTRRVPYTCVRQVPEYYSVTDYYVTFDVQFEFSSVPEGLVADETLKLSTNGAALDLRSEHSSNQILLVANATQQTRILAEPADNRAGEKHIQMTYRIEPLDLADVTQSLVGGLSRLSASRNEVSFEMGEVLFPELFQFALKIDRRKAIVSDARVFDGTVSEAALSTSAPETLENGQKVSIDLSKVALTEALKEDASYNVEVRVEVAGSNGRFIVNPKSLGKLDQVKLQTKNIKF